MMKSCFVALITLLMANAAMAQGTAEAAESAFKGEAEAGAIVVSGNSDSESYNTKALMTYTQDSNIYTANGRYLKASALGVESARNWEAGLRYDRQLQEYFGVYVGQKAESDVFNGYIQRDSTDAGFKYSIIKSDDMNLISEAGYRYQETNTTDATTGTSYDNLGRVYVEYNQKANESLSYKYWVEYLPNFTNPDAYLMNTEASMNVMISSMFSLKLAYLLQYQNVIAPATATKYSTTTTTVNLVAKF